jgi:anti-sigma-K factor RskA
MPLTAVVDEQAPPRTPGSASPTACGPRPPAAASAPRCRGGAAWRSGAGCRAWPPVAALALGLLLTQPGTSEPPVMVVLQPTGNAAGIGGSVVASFSADGRAAVARPVQPVAVQTDRTLELWWAPPEGKPKSLGLIRADGVTVLRPGALPGGLKGGGIDHMAVSVEPAGGSPTGQPTGPVVFYGKLVP